MQLSYNLIKSNSALEVSKKKIETNYLSREETLEENKEQDIKSIEAEIRKSYESLGASILKKAKREAEELLMKSRKTAIEIEKTSYEEGYAQGKENGFEDGYKEGLQKAKLETEEEVKRYIKKSEKILESANSKFKEYLKLKEKDIINIAFEMAAIIAKKELQQSEGILPLLEDILNEAKAEENIIIKCNTVHVKVIEDKVDYYKKAYAIKGEIFIIEDPLMEGGNAIVEKSTGKAIIGLDIGLEKLQEALFK
ncbi:MAG: flagellar biosynthesis/type III secretory pathway-like protein [Clostridium sp.]|nr:flagellar biosynthesis/type III secretory pathway-like protein [Clostridium sp.]